MAYYPAWETLLHERLSPRSDTVGRRLELLRRLAGNSELPAPRIVVAPVRSVLQPQVTGLGNLRPIRLVVGEEIDLTELAAALVDAAYTRVDLVERRGEFAARRHRRRLSADRGAPSTRGLLRRHRRRDSLLLRR